MQQARQSDAWADIYEKILVDGRYKTGVRYGKPRTGHAEGTVETHLMDLDANLERFANVIELEEYWKLKVLIHTHDTFKYWADRDVAILHPKSHASLARQFLSDLTDDQDLLRMVQFHDEGFALWKQFEAKGHYDQQRFEHNVLSIKDIELFLIFTLIDGYTPGKDHVKIRWFANEVAKTRQLSLRFECIMGIFGL